MAQKQNSEIGFRSIQLLKGQTLGIGSYGKVCKAKCDDLLCAAKIIHETLFDPTAQQKIECHREHRLPFRRFRQECEFMSAIKHPNIVQYLGMHQDPETGLPVLLMELMDDSLTHFLESSQDSVPYHIQVNFCHDITLAISYLHSNGIIHRDLSSNNVLLRGNVIAKVTDFGMAKLGDANPQATRISLTMVPGTDVYMPPEAVKEQPVYTAKIDCFAIGALIIQILTRQFPKPGERHEKIQINHPRFPGGTVDVRVPEIERRQNHISQVDPNYPLLPIALHCLKDSDVERPSAQELCRGVAALKETPQYTESVRSAQERRPEHNSTTVGEGQIRELQQSQQKDDKKDDVIQSLKEQHTQQIRRLQQIVTLQNIRLQEKEQTTAAKQHENHQLKEQLEETTRVKEEREKQLEHVTHMLQTSLQATAQLETRVKELEQNLETKPHELQVAKPQTSLRVPTQTHQRSDTSSRVVRLTRDTLIWRKGKKAPCEMSRPPDAVVDGDMVYFRTSIMSLYAYNSVVDTWNRLPDCRTKHAPLAVVKHHLTTIGGRLGAELTNKLFSLTGEGQSRVWSEEFPPMPTKRDSAIAVCTGQALIVAGGENQYDTGLRTVEVMDASTKEWSTAADLHHSLSMASVSICGYNLYMLGGWMDGKATKSVYTCSLVDLFLSCRSKLFGERLAQSLSLTGPARSKVWNKVADLPVTQSTCVTLHGRLLAIGGDYSSFDPILGIYIYNTISNKWERLSIMTVARFRCFAAVLPNNQLMVAGGITGKRLDTETDSVEIATIV